MPEDRIWAADTGCFGKKYEHDNDKYLAWLQKEDHRRESCLFATAPDVYGDADATLEVALPMLDRIRRIGYKAALVCQDHLKSENVPWGLFDVFFIGGKDDWRKSDAFRELVKEAVDRGLWVHMGRVNSLTRMRYAKSLGCKSVDGTHLAFNPTTSVANIAKWLTIIDMERYSITELSQLTGITTRNIRYYIVEKLVPPADDSIPGAMYSMTHRLRLEIIRDYRSRHYSLNEIREMFNGTSDDDLRRILGYEE